MQILTTSDHIVLNSLHILDALRKPQLSANKLDVSFSYVLGFPLLAARQRTQTGDATSTKDTSALSLVTLPGLK